MQYEILHAVVAVKGHHTLAMLNSISHSSLLINIIINITQTRTKIEFSVDVLLHFYTYKLNLLKISRHHVVSAHKNSQCCQLSPFFPRPITLVTQLVY